MEIIKMSGYTTEEKVEEIQHLFPRLQEHGLTKRFSTGVVTRKKL
jgi:ATP-dependent Lon protease